jgi:hypothetical protein
MSKFEGTVDYMNRAKIKVLVRPNPDQIPKNSITCLVWECVNCHEEFYIYILEDGDVHFGCPCGLYQVISGPFAKAILN